MTEFQAFHTPDGEWLEVTTAQYSGPVLVIGSEDHDITTAMEPKLLPESDNIDLDSSLGWVPMTSASGTFSIFAPEARPLEDWTLKILGLPRIRNGLNVQGMVNLFGEDTLRMVNTIYKRTLSRHQSTADLRDQEQTMGPISSETMRSKLGRLGHFIINTPDDLNEITRANRQELLNNTREQSGRLTVARNVLINLS
jgi:hypothetical protein